jgi:hypothetical protein
MLVMLRISGSGQTGRGSAVRGPGYVMIAANGDSLFKRLMLAIGRPELASDPALAHSDGRAARNDELDVAIDAWAGKHLVAEVIHMLEKAEVASPTILSTLRGRRVDRMPVFTSLGVTSRASRLGRREH